MLWGTSRGQRFQAERVMLGSRPTATAFSGTLDAFARAMRYPSSPREKTYTYAVESTQIVNPGDVEVLAPSDRPVLTLVTCFPFYFVGDAPQRFIVKAELVD